jgi:polyphenol oxidase
MPSSSIISNIHGVRHCFFTREGGHSTGIYSGLNCGPGSSDDPDVVSRNRAHVENNLDLDTGSLVTLYQVHSPTAVHVTAPWATGEAPEADAMVTDKPGIGLGILTADCVPVLFADSTGGIVGAAHAGWKGAVGGVLEATVDAMEELGSTRSDIYACTGPSIRYASYEVGCDMRDQIIGMSDDNAQFFMEGGRADHYQFDLTGYVLTRLAKSGVGMIEDTAGDTYTDEDEYFSYRRMTHRGEADYGRQISVITLED